MGISAVLPEAHVVHLVQYWDDGVVPSTLRVRPRASVGARVVLRVLMGVLVVAAAVPIVILWTFPTPGWWFSLMFTVVIGMLVVGCWAGFLGSLRRGRSREWAVGRWAELLPAVRPSPGIVLTRDVATREDGAVARFSLTVASRDGSRATGVWQPQFSMRGTLLQSQVPGVGRRCGCGGPSGRSQRIRW
ncbi:MAG: hypothetical protein WKF57_16080 [Nakamurella sp.]